MQAAGMEVAVAADQVQVPRHGPAVTRADLLALLVSGRRGVGRDLVREDVLPVAVAVEALFRVEHRVDLRGAGDVHPLDAERVDVTTRRVRRHPVDLPGDVDRTVPLRGQRVDHVVQAPGVVAADPQAIALRSLDVRLLLARREHRPPQLGCDPHDVVQVQVPDRRLDEASVGQDLDHARLEPGHVALRGGAGREDAGVGGTADLGRVRARLAEAPQVRVLPRVNGDRVAATAERAHVRVGRPLQLRLLLRLRGHAGGHEQHRDRAQNKGRHHIPAEKSLHQGQGSDRARRRTISTDGPKSCGANRTRRPPVSRAGRRSPRCRPGRGPGTEGRLACAIR